MRRSLLVSLIVAVAVLLSLDLGVITAQRDPGSAPSRGPGWRPRRGSLIQTTPFTTAELTTVLSRLTEVERTFLQVDELAHPVGFEIEPLLGGGGVTESLMGYGYDLMFYLPKAGEGSACVSVSVNSVPGPGLNGMEGYRDAAGDFMFENPRGDPIPGATHVWNNSATEPGSLDAAGRTNVVPGLVMFTSGRVSPLEAVTRERFQRAKVAFFEAFRSGVQRETPYDRWVIEAPRRKADREALRATLPPDKAVALLKTLENAEREATASLQAQDAADRAENARQIALYTPLVDRARAQLAAMPPAERLEPAWVERRIEQVAASPGDLVPLVPADTPLAARVVVTKPDLYRGQRSRVNARVIQVTLGSRLTCAAPAVKRAIQQTYRKLDWAFFARLVDSNTK